MTTNPADAEPDYPPELTVTNQLMDAVRQSRNPEVLAVLISCAIGDLERRILSLEIDTGIR